MHCGRRKWFAVMNTNVNPNFAVIVPFNLVKVSNLDKAERNDYRKIGVNIRIHQQPTFSFFHKALF